MVEVPEAPEPPPANQNSAPSDISLTAGMESTAHVVSVSTVGQAGSAGDLQDMAGMLAGRKASEAGTDKLPRMAEGVTHRRQPAASCHQLRSRHPRSAQEHLGTPDRCPSDYEFCLCSRC